MSENSYFRNFSAQVSQIVFLAYLTVLRLITTVWPEMSENSYLRDFSAQVSQIVFTVYHNCMTWNVRKHISPRFQCRGIKNRVLSLFDRFTAYYNCMRWTVRKLIFPRFQCISITNPSLSFFLQLNRLLQLYDLKSQKTGIFSISVHKYYKSCSQRIWPFYGLLQLNDLKCQKTHVFAIWVHKYHKSLFLAYLTVLLLIPAVWPEMSENSYLRDFSAQVSQIVFLDYLTVLRLITTVWPEMSENSYLLNFSA